MLVNSLWEQPTERVEECIVAKLPAPTFVLPRVRKCPVPKPLTKWEKFAQEKGIRKVKKDKKVFDADLEVSAYLFVRGVFYLFDDFHMHFQKWVPTYGFKRAQAEREKDWVLEVPLTADPMEDQFEKKKNLKSEKVAKNELQRMRNIVKAKKMPVPRIGYAGPEAASSSDVSSELCFSLRIYWIIENFFVCFSY